MAPVYPGNRHSAQCPSVIAPYAGWMILWPVENQTSGLPLMPNKFGTYVMFEGTPYAHLMVYQDPMKMR